MLSPSPPGPSQTGPIDGTSQTGLIGGPSPTGPIDGPSPTGPIGGPTLASIIVGWDRLRLAQRFVSADDGQMHSRLLSRQCSYRARCEWPIALSAMLADKFKLAMATLPTVSRKASGGDADMDQEPQRVPNVSWHGARHAFSELIQIQTFVIFPEVEFLASI